MKTNERLLFFSLWILLILSVLLWKFWPSPKLSVTHPELVLRKELHERVEKAILESTGPSEFLVRLRFFPAFVRQFEKGSREIHLGFRFLSSRGPLSMGNTTAKLEPPETDLLVRLSNPERVTPRAIELYLDKD